MSSVLLGYKLGSGEPVEIPIAHMVVAGQSQQAGKTTTLEALIGRAKLPALGFITKRGERSFQHARRIRPYFRDRADWQYVAAVLEATLQEKLKFERAWIMKASKGARTLADVQKNVKELHEKERRGLAADVYLTLDHYLDIVVPRIAEIEWARSISIQPGVNVMDMADANEFPAELQGLVISSTLEWVYQKCEGTITLIPEAWEFLPQARGSPVKRMAMQLIRKGAGLQNFVWLDSQDIGGIDKEVLRQCTVWLFGVQRETNEIERNLANIPAGVKKPKAADIATLKKGQFIVSYGDQVLTVYVHPAWLDAERAIAAAKLGGVPADPRGELIPEVSRVATVHGLCKLDSDAPAGVKRDCDEHLAGARDVGYREGFDAGYLAANATLLGQLAGVITSASAFREELQKIGKQLAKDLPTKHATGGEVKARLALVGDSSGEHTLPADSEFARELRRAQPSPEETAKTRASVVRLVQTMKVRTMPTPAMTPDEDALYQKIRERLIAEAPAILKVIVEKPELTIEIERREIVVDLASHQGQVAFLLSEGFMDAPRNGNQVWTETKRRWGYGGNKARTYEQLDALLKLGFVTRESDGYQAVPGMKSRVVEK
jgi:hypothetical protein